MNLQEMELNLQQVYSKLLHYKQQRIRPEYFQVEIVDLLKEEAIKLNNKNYYDEIKICVFSCNTSWKVAMIASLKNDQQLLFCHAIQKLNPVPENTVPAILQMILRKGECTFTEHRTFDTPQNQLNDSSIDSKKKENQAGALKVIHKTTISQVNKLKIPQIFLQGDDNDSKISVEQQTTEIENSEKNETLINPNQEIEENFNIHATQNDNSQFSDEQPKTEIENSEKNETVTIPNQEIEENFNTAQQDGPQFKVEQPTTEIENSEKNETVINPHHEIEENFNTTQNDNSQYSVEQPRTEIENSEKMHKLQNEIKENLNVPTIKKLPASKSCLDVNFDLQQENGNSVCSSTNQNKNNLIAEGNSGISEVCFDLNSEDLQQDETGDSTQNGNLTIPSTNGSGLILNSDIIYDDTENSDCSLTNQNKNFTSEGNSILNACLNLNSGDSQHEKTENSTQNETSISKACLNFNSGDLQHDITENSTQTKNLSLNETSLTTANTQQISEEIQSMINFHSSIQNQNKNCDNSFDVSMILPEPLISTVIAFGQTCISRLPPQVVSIVTTFSHNCITTLSGICQRLNGFLDKIFQNQNNTNQTLEIDNERVF